MRCIFILSNEWPDITNNGIAITIGLRMIVAFCVWLICMEWPGGNFRCRLARCRAVHGFDRAVTICCVYGCCMPAWLNQAVTTARQAVHRIMHGSTVRLKYYKVIIIWFLGVYIANMCWLYPLIWYYCKKNFFACVFNNSCSRGLRSSNSHENIFKVMKF